MKIGHHSSRLDRTPANFKSAANLVADNCSVCSWTEISQDKNTNAAKDQLKARGWGFWQPTGDDLPSGSDENALSWDKQVWDMEAHGNKKMSEIRWHREGGALAPFTVALAGLFNRIGTSERWIIVTTHMPANTTDNDGCKVWWNKTEDRNDC